MKLRYMLTSKPDFNSRCSFEECLEAELFVCGYNQLLGFGFKLNVFVHDSDTESVSIFKRIGLNGDTLSTLANCTGKCD